MNLSFDEAVPLAVCTTFVIKNIRVSVTVSCPQEVIYTTADADKRSAREECFLRYSDIILSAQKKLCDIISAL